jgi:hypothetical protein
VTDIRETIFSNMNLKFISTTQFNVPRARDGALNSQEKAGAVNHVIQCFIPFQPKLNYNHQQIS